MSESPERRHHRRDSRSPRRREYLSKGSGRSSSRRRSPGPSVPYDRRRNDDDRERRGNGGGGGRARDNGYGDRDRVRDRAKEDDQKRAPTSIRRAEYSSKDREQERALERKRYDDDVMKDDPDAPKPEPEKPNFAASGLLAKETNTVKGVEVKYNEPPEARKPTKNWRLYVFKGTEQVDLIHIYRQSCYLIGRDTVVTDIPIAHPSCSKQHAAIQYRQISEKNEYGDVTTSVKPFVIDLESTNGTYVNDIEIPKSRFYELRGSDVIKFGTSSREYVLLSEDASA
ncbi:smad nuclear-interacting protein 1 [Kwoniella heveanensis BCC8398]|uniref:Smad nuclear-interacting protein 1 n=1 Tax=Kwoniella heveanensis BCC8398 TaxID=1296120 RepID=A0A1B9H4I9_9TREE|nr:smad nuclear-interacting protein 1 [Kwoniella heveanensis BCC8398]